MRVILAAPRGFCAGVDRAIDIVEMALEVYGPPIYVRHEIIHNEHVVGRLRDKGAIFTDFLTDVPSGSHLIFSAHGVSPAVRREAADRHLKVIDATCPLVTKIHLEVHKYLKRGYGIFYIGHRGHVETEGTLGEAPDRLILITTEEEVATLPEPTEEKLIYLTQTTLSIDETQGIVDALKRRFPRLETPPTDDICYATQNRQDAVKVLARRADTILVVGSHTSSNSRSLRQVAAAYGARAFLIDDRHSLTDEMLTDAETVGVTAGASAPEDVVQGVLTALQERGATEIEEFVLLKEDMEFRVPPGLVELYRGKRSDSSVAPSVP
ncbi:MAG: 4-hydroxy-3-methylbut-2-enyl diphosphate reductase [Capsulimonadales bacterium]|nr:4-hydroxy-3-methylbut-2-enyl diphosphate reductase [Capsulimonadales bacterium]